MNSNECHVIMRQRHDPIAAITDAAIMYKTLVKDRLEVVEHDDRVRFRKQREAAMAGDQRRKVDCTVFGESNQGLQPASTHSVKRCPVDG